MNALTKSGIVRTLSAFLTLFRWSTGLAV